jgi:hypothetical protein
MISRRIAHQTHLLYTVVLEPVPEPRTKLK